MVDIEGRAREGGVHCQPGMVSHYLGEFGSLCSIYRVCTHIVNRMGTGHDLEGGWPVAGEGSFTIVQVSKTYKLKVLSLVYWRRYDNAYIRDSTDHICRYEYGSSSETETN